MANARVFLINEQKRYSVVEVAPVASGKEMHFKYDREAQVTLWGTKGGEQQ